VKNPFFSNASLAERLYPVILRFPKVLKESLARGIAQYVRHRLINRGLPERLTIFVTDRCNLRCSHCFISTTKQRKNWEMGIPEYRLFFEKSRGVFSQALLTGGEPTLRDDLDEILLLASHAGAIPAITIFTNGILGGRLIKAVSRALTATPLRLHFQLSIDGPASFHDANRGVAGALDKTLETIKSLKDLKKAWVGRIGRVTLCTAISRTNLADLPSIINKVRSLGALHAFTFVRSSETGVFNLKKNHLASNFAPVGFRDFLTVEEMDRALLILHQHLWCHKPNSLFYMNNRRILENIVKSLKKMKPQAACFSGVADLILLPNGDVARCEMLKSFANLKDYHWDLKSLILSEAYQRHLKETKGCWCIHDCAIGLGMIYDANHLLRLFDHI